MAIHIWRGNRLAWYFVSLLITIPINGAGLTIVIFPLKMDRIAFPGGASVEETVSISSHHGNPGRWLRCT